MIRWAIVSMVVCSLLTTSVAWAATTSSIVGTVRGQNGAPIAGAEVTLEGVIRLSKKTDNAGAFEFRDITTGSYTIVVTVHDKTVGCIVDEVTQVMRIAADQIQPVPVSMAAVARRFIAGLARLEDRLLIILDTDRLFAPDELDSASLSQSTTTPTPGRFPESAA